MDPRLCRRDGAGEAEVGGLDPSAELAAATEGAFRVDLERIRFSPYFSRLAAVTQVVSRDATGQSVHNRLTHTMKVVAVARAIATSLRQGPHAELLDELGGCDPVVVQAAASAHDLGHPPFGHLGEAVLDRIARYRFGLVDGFEGNAQTFRILVALDVHGDNDTDTGTAGQGLNLTAAVRAAVLKYPWARVARPAPHPSALPVPPRGGGADPTEPPGSGSAKYSAYLLDAAEMASVLAAYPAVGPLRQTPECAVMDVADDIAYSLHDLDDFHRAGVLQHASVAAEFRTWLRHRDRLRDWGDAQLAAQDRRPGAALELLRRRLRSKDDWIFDDDAFEVAVGRVGTDLVDGLLAVPFDGSLAAERAIGSFTGSWIAHLQESVTVQADPPVRSAFVGLDRQAWHEVAVLKFVHQRFVLDRPDLAMYQRGQRQILQRLTGELHEWLTDPVDAGRAPRRLLDLVELATAGYHRLRDREPELLARPDGALPDDAGIAELGRGRGIIDYVASLTDDRAMAAAGALGGRAGQRWDAQLGT
ncbi:deoxyguanosinetriphosphate triphosphohydrolase family protein [Nakamurella leprariae]|uniref:DNTP triphosphohydrolase n=1 Tax=Nakamurella leprariae TaxID=2803911 RepID=A0A939C0M5_9ACTN|nr:dNTP triphosphohydrolase [Nakamurella leprariae]MBM9466194.1 dNTP triphosphohydrolase [Nakamurella leprariae]